MLIFKTNMDRTERCITYNLHSQLKHRWGGIKSTTKSILRASRSRSNTCPDNKPWGPGGLQPVCRSGQRGWNSVRVFGGNGTVGAQNGESHDGRWFPLIDRHQGGWPHTSRQHHRFLFFVLCVCVLLFSFKFYQEVLRCWSGLGATTLLLISRF